MAQELEKWQDELTGYKYRFGLLQDLPCSEEENIEYQKIVEQGGNLPKGIYAYKEFNGAESKKRFCKVREVQMTEEEKREFFECKQTCILKTLEEHIKTIKNSVIFFTVLTIIGMLAYLLSLLRGLD